MRRILWSISQDVQQKASNRRKGLPRLAATLDETLHVKTSLNAGCTSSVPCYIQRSITSVTAIPEVPAIPEGTLRKYSIPGKSSSDIFPERYSLCTIPWTCFGIFLRRKAGSHSTAAVPLQSMQDGSGTDNASPLTIEDLHRRTKPGFSSALLTSIKISCRLARTAFAM